MGILVVNKLLLLKNRDEMSFKYNTEKHTQTQWMEARARQAKIRNCIGYKRMKIEPWSDRMEERNSETWCSCLARLSSTVVLRIGEALNVLALKLELGSTFCCLTLADLSLLSATSQCIKLIC